MLFQSGIDAAEFGVLLLMAIGSLLTLVYTNRAFIRIWWQKPSGSNGAKPTGDHLLAPAILIVLILILGLWAEPLLQVARETSLWLDSPGLYIQAVLRG
jgi:formate hydrogenlyase subunit 3/multisubunit Na+/H+ antiporter MnhD subunit